MKVFDGWRKRKQAQAERTSKGPAEVVLSHEQEQVRALFAHLGTLHVAGENEKKETYERGYRDFIALVSDPRIQSVGAGNGHLFVGTNMVYLLDESTAKRHKIGEIIIDINVCEKSYTFENITETLRSGNNVYAHPHISGGRLCMTGGEEEINQGFMGGELLHVVRILVAALHTLDSAPYSPAAIEHWPLDETQEA